MELRDILIVIGVLLGTILIWGLIGGNEASSIGVTCDMGVGDSLCWKWHKNLIGQAGEAIGKLLGK